MALWSGGGMGRGLLAGCVMAVWGAGLVGCAHQGGPDTSASAAVAASASAETDVRRRARIRLELAANYLQMGQSGVALEEVQQSIATDPGYADPVFSVVGRWFADIRPAATMIVAGLIRPEMKIEIEATALRNPA